MLLNFFSHFHRRSAVGYVPMDTPPQLTTHPYQGCALTKWAVSSLFFEFSWLSLEYYSMVQMFHRWLLKCKRKHIVYCRLAQGPTLSPWHRIPFGWIGGFGGSDPTRHLSATNLLYHEWSYPTLRNHSQFKTAWSRSSWQHQCCDAWHTQVCSRSKKPRLRVRHSRAFCWLCSCFCFFYFRNTVLVMQVTAYDSDHICYPWVWHTFD